MNIIITGASTGIGYHTALSFASNTNNKVFAVARRGNNLTELSKREVSGKIIPVKMDLAEYHYEKLQRALLDEGVSHIDILIHNAGFLMNKPFEEIEAADWETHYRVNVIGPAMLTRNLLRYMGKESPAHIVMISSIGGVTGTQKFPGLSAYSSSKGALTILSEVLAEEFKERNIRVNCLALGSVQTDMLAAAFPGYVAGTTPEEISDFIYRFSLTGWKLFNGKTLQVSTTNP